MTLKYIHPRSSQLVLLDRPYTFPVSGLLLPCLCLTPFFRYYPLLKWTWLPVTLRTHLFFLTMMLNHKPCVLCNLHIWVIQDIIAYFPKFKDITWLWLWLCLRNGQFVIPILSHHMQNKCTKFEVSSCSHSGDILGGQNLNGSRDHNHAPFRDGLSSVGCDYPWSSCVPNLKSLLWKATKKYRNWGG